MTSCAPWIATTSGRRFDFSAPTPDMVDASDIVTASSRLFRFTGHGRRQPLDLKIRTIGRWLREHGASQDNPAHVAIGISTDEIERATSRKTEPYEIVEYPLLTLEHRLAPHGASRADCERIIADAGLPVPPKSSCFFCPFHRPTHFADMARTEPELFAKCVELENTLNRRRETLGKDPVYLTRYGRPLEQVYENVQLGLLDDVAVDEGYRCGDRCDT